MSGERTGMEKLLEGVDVGKLLEVLNDLKVSAPPRDVLQSIRAVAEELLGKKDEELEFVAKDLDEADALLVDSLGFLNELEEEKGVQHSDDGVAAATGDGGVEEGQKVEGQGESPQRR